MMDEIQEQQEQAREIAEVIAQPVAGADYDEDELLAELEELEQEVRLETFPNALSLFVAEIQRGNARCRS